LVVIAIISLLVSILLPSLKKAKDLARRAVCMSDIRTVATSTLLYAENNDSRTPIVYGELSQWPAVQDSYPHYLLLGDADTDGLGMGLLVADGLMDARAAYCPFSTTYTYENNFNPSGGSWGRYCLHFSNPIDQDTFALVSDYFLYGRWYDSAGVQAFDHEGLYNHDEFTIAFSDGSVAIMPDPNEVFRDPPAPYFTNGDAINHNNHQIDAAWRVLVDPQHKHSTLQRDP